MIRQEVLNKKIEGCLLKYDKEIQMLLPGQEVIWIRRITGFGVSVSLKMLMREATELRCVWGRRCSRVR
jgi:hypothetical protein